MKGKLRFAWSRNVKHHFLLIRILTSVCKPDEGQCLRVSLTGAVSSQRVTEEREGTLSTVGNRAKRAKAQGCLTARQTGRAEAKAGLSDPTARSGTAVAYRIKATPGITG